MPSHTDLTRQARAYLDRECPGWRELFIREFEEQARAAGRSTNWESISLRLEWTDGRVVDLVLLARGGPEGEADREC